MQNSLSSNDLQARSKTRERSEADETHKKSIRCCKHVCQREHMRKEQMKRNCTEIRSNVKFYFQLLLTLILLIYSMYSLEYGKRTNNTKNSSTWFALVSGLIGYWLPNPKKS